MVTACDCLTPAVFGHDWYCELGAGPPHKPPYWAPRSMFRPEPGPKAMPVIPPPAAEIEHPTRRQLRVARVHYALVLLRDKLDPQ